MENFLDIRIDGTTTKEGLYNAYVVYCHMVTKPPVSKNKFGRYIKNYPYVGEGRPIIGDKQVEVWTGITLNKESAELMKAEKESMDKDDF
jgi:hypothetical protein